MKIKDISSYNTTNITQTLRQLYTTYERFSIPEIEGKVQLALDEIINLIKPYRDIVERALNEDIFSFINHFKNYDWDTSAIVNIDNIEGNYAKIPYSDFVSISGVYVNYQQFPPINYEFIPAKYVPIEQFKKRKLKHASMYTPCYTYYSSYDTSATGFFKLFLLPEPGDAEGRILIKGERYEIETKDLNKFPKFKEAIDYMALYLLAISNESGVEEYAEVWQKNAYDLLGLSFLLTVGGNAKTK